MTGYTSLLFLRKKQDLDCEIPHRNRLCVSMYVYYITITADILLF